MSCAGVDLQHDLVIDALFGLAVEALFTLGVAVDGGLHGALEENLVDHLGDRGPAALLALLLEMRRR
jgi:hypothetical protein